MTVGSAANVAFGGLVTVTVDPAAGITVSGQNDILTVFGESVTADFAFSNVNSALKLHVSNVNFSLGSLLSVSSAFGDLTISSTGVSGSAGGTVHTAIPGLSGDLSLGFGLGGISISGLTDSISFGDLSLAGAFSFIPAVPGVPSFPGTGTLPSIPAAPGLPSIPGLPGLAGIHLVIPSFTVSLGLGLVGIDNGSAALNVDFKTGAISGSMAGTVLSGPTFAALGITFGGQVSVTVANNTIQASGVNDSLTILGQSFSAGFTFFKDKNGLELTVGGLNLSLGGGLLSVTGASGTLHLDSTGLSGTTAGTVTSTLVGLSGSLGVGFGAGALQISGTNDTLALGDQSLSGDFAFSSSGGGSDLSLNITNLTTSLGGGLITVGGAPGSNTGATASLTVSGGHTTGTFSGYVAAGTSAGVQFGGQVTVTVAATGLTAAGQNDTLTIAGPSISGNFTFAEDATSHVLTLGVSGVSLAIPSVLSVSNITGTVNIVAAGVSGYLSGTLGTAFAGLTANAFGIGFGPGTLAVVASGAALAFGGQRISGDFNFVSDANGVHLTSSNLSADLGGGLVTVAGAAASLNVAQGQVTGSFTGNVAAGGSVTGGAVGFAGLVSVNVTPGALTASGTGDTLTFGGYQLAADFSFAKDASGLELSVSHLNFALGSALSIGNASGTLLVTAAGVSGSAAGTISSNLGSLSISGALAIAFGNGALSIAGTGDQLAAGTESISGDFTFTKDQTGLHLSANHFSASLGGGLVTVTNGAGSLDVGNGAIAGSFSGTIAAGNVGGGVQFGGAISVTVGPGGIVAATPAGSVDTLTIAGQQVSAAFSFSKNANGLELSVSNLTASLGGAISLQNGGGTLLVKPTGISGSASGTISSSFTGFSFSGGVAVTFAPGTLSVAGTGDTLAAGDQSISGDFTFVHDSTGTHLTASNFNASLGGGLVTVANASGALDLSGGTISGGFTGTVAAGGGVSGVGFNGAITVHVAPGSITASTPFGQTDTITLPGQSLAATFSFAEDANGLELTLAGVNVSLAGGAIAVSNAGGTLHVTKTGAVGDLHGGLSATVPGVTFNSTSFDVSFGGARWRSAGQASASPPMASRSAATSPSPSRPARSPCISIT